MKKLPIPLPPLRAWSGPETQDLVLHPGDFGLGKIPARLQPDQVTTIVCGFCATGCGLNVHLRDGEAVNLSADTEYPVNLGMACPKGWEALTPLRAPDRATTPLLRNPETGELEPCDWERALTVFCERLQRIKAEHGPESVAFLSTGQVPTEEMALLGSLFKFGMGFIHCDSNTRQCMATSHVAYKQSFGFDAPPYTYADLEESDVLVFIGSNLCIAHPIMWQRVLRNPHQPEIIVLDPRKTETAMAATKHYAHRPKSDLVLLYGLANLLIENGWTDRDYINAHTSSFAEFAEFVRAFPMERVVKESGLSAEQVQRFARTIGEGKRVSFWWTMGVNQSHEGTRTAQAIINLALITGNIGRPGTGANSVTGQCNAMGSRVYGNITSLLGGHDVNNADYRAKVSSVLGIDESLFPRQQAMAYDQIVEAIKEGKIKALWVVATNSAHSWVRQAEFAEILAKLDFLVVQDLYTTTDTAKRADLVLPAAGWGEKEGTFINSERRIGLLKKVARAPGQALSDFHIFKLIAQFWGCGEMFARWKSPEVAFQLLTQVSRGMPCDISGIADYEQIDRAGGIQWPLRPADELKPERRLFEDGQYYTDDGRAKLIFEEPRPQPTPTTAEYPCVLLTGRGTSSQWHTQTRTAKSDVLRQLYPAECYVEINPQDARELKIAAGGRVRVVSPQGEATVTAFITPTVQPGHLFMPMHYRETNQLTFPAFDPYSRQPAYKSSAARIEPAI